MDERISFSHYGKQELRRSHYTTGEKTQIVHVFYKVNLHQESGKGNIEQKDQRIGKDRAFLPDIVLVGLKKNEGQHQVEREGRAGQEDEDVGRNAPGVGCARRPVENECKRGIEGEKIGGKGDDKIRFGYRD